MSKIKVPGGAFYAGEGLNVDPITRTVSVDGGFGTTTPDWNQNDETASDYIKNRPGGYEAVQMSDIYNATITSSVAIGGDAENVYELLNNAGAICTVVLDGITYENMVVASDGSQAYIGDKSFVNYPFVIVQYFDIESFTEGFQLTTKTSSSSHTLTIKARANTVVKFDAKYLPNGNILNGNLEGGLTNSNTNSVVSKYSVAIGSNNIIDGNTSQVGNNLVVGSNNENRRYDSCVIGNSNINSGASNVIFMAGIGLKDTSPSVVLGDYSQNVNQNCVLSVGIGDSDTERKTGFAVLKNGGLIVPSSTSGSTKYFAITVDDAGTITATETTI